MKKQVIFFYFPTVFFITLLLIAFYFPNFYSNYIEKETGLLEISHIVIPFLTAFFSFSLLLKKHIWNDKLMMLLLICLTLGNLYIAGEEASYGQHFFGWEVGEDWGKVNDQQETNLHNTSSWLDQKPRTLLEISIIISGIIFPLIYYFKRNLIPQFMVRFLPTLYFLPIALLVEISRSIERFGLNENTPLFLDIRYSEIQEFYFFYFLIFYVLLLKKRNEAK